MQDVIWQPGMTLDDVEKLVIVRAINYYKNNKSQTAASLGIAIRTLDAKLEKYGQPRQVSALRKLEMFRKVQSAMIHYGGDKVKVAVQLGISLSRLEECINEAVSEKARRGILMESDEKVSPEPALPLPKQKEVQAVLSSEADVGGALKHSKPNEAATKQSSRHRSQA